VLLFFSACHAVVVWLRDKHQKYRFDYLEEQEKMKIAWPEDGSAARCACANQRTKAQKLQVNAEEEQWAISKGQGHKMLMSLVAAKPLVT
jgi:hypothetical protein